MPATLTRRHMEPLEQAGSRYAEWMRLKAAAFLLGRVHDYLCEYISGYNNRYWPARHEPASGGSRTSRGSRSPRGHADGPGRMAPRRRPCRAGQSHAGAAASPSARIEPGREHLADRMFVAAAEVARPALCGERGLRRMVRHRASRIGDEPCSRIAPFLSVSTLPR